MNSTNNNSFEIAAKKVFSDLYALIKEDENERFILYKNGILVRKTFSEKKYFPSVFTLGN
jgi:hypothetical protein